MKFPILPAFLLLFSLSTPLFSASERQESSSKFLSEDDVSLMAEAVSEAPQLQIGPEVDLTMISEEVRAILRELALLYPEVTAPTYAMSYRGWCNALSARSNPDITSPANYSPGTRRSGIR